MNNWKERFINSLINGPHGNVLLLIQYGSLRLSSDSDYLAIVEGSELSENILIAGLDLLALSNDIFSRHLRLLDPLVTEPLLTGSSVYGDSGLREKALAELKAQKPTQETIRFLVSRSFIAYNDAYKIGTAGLSKDFRSNRQFWSTLSYSVGYWSFASQYKHKQSQVAHLVEVIDSMPSKVKRLWKKIINAKVSRLPSSLDVLSEWTSILLK